MVGFASEQFQHFLNRNPDRCTAAPDAHNESRTIATLKNLQAEFALTNNFSMGALNPIMRANQLFSFYRNTHKTAYAIFGFMM